MFMPFATTHQKVTNTRLSVVRHIFSDTKWMIWIPIPRRDLLRNASLHTHWLFFSLFVCVSLPRVFTLIQTDKSPARLFYLFCQEFETCSHNDGWPFNGFTFFVRRSIWYLGWLHYFCTLLFSIPLPLFYFTFFLSKNYLTTWWDESLLKLKTCSVSTCLVSLQG